MYTLVFDQAMRSREKLKKMCARIRPIGWNGKNCLDMNCQSGFSTHTLTSYESYRIANGHFK